MFLILEEDENRGRERERENTKNQTVSFSLLANKFA